MSFQTSPHCGLLICLVISNAITANWSPASDTVSFKRDVMPILRQNCLACHNEQLAEGGLNVESSESILRGGDSGASVTIADPRGSLLIARARGENDSIMPPEENVVGARRLNDVELDKLEKWIAQGAAGDLTADSMRDATSQHNLQLPEGLRSIYALQFSPVAPLIAVGRGNVLDLVSATDGALVQTLSDPSLQARSAKAIAHLDNVNALAFSPDGRTLVTGGYRTIKIWKQQLGPVALGDVEPLIRALIASTSGGTEVEDVEEEKSRILAVISSQEVGPGRSDDELQWIRWLRDKERQTGKVEQLKSLLGPATERKTKEEAAKTKVIETRDKLLDDVANKKKALEEVLARQQTVLSADPPPNDEQKAGLQTEVDNARNALNAAEMQLVGAEQAAKTAMDGLRRATESVTSLETEIGEETVAVDVLAQRIAGREAEIKGKTVEVMIRHHTDKMFAAILSDRTAVIYDAESNGCIRRLSGVPEKASRWLFIDDWLVAIQESQISSEVPVQGVVVWNTIGEWGLNMTIGSPLEDSQFVDRITALSFSPDGRFIAVGSGEPSRTGIVSILETERYQLVDRWDENHSDIVLSARFSPDGRQLATAGADKQVRVVNFPGGDNIRSLEGHTHHVLGLAWMSDGRRLASVSSDHTAKIWNSRTGEAERTIAVGSKEVTAIDFIGLTSQIAVATGDGVVRIYNSDDGGMLRNFEQVSGFQHAIATSAVGDMLTAGGTDGRLRIWRSDQPNPHVQLE